MRAGLALRSRRGRGCGGGLAKRASEEVGIRREGGVRGGGSGWARWVGQEDQLGFRAWGQGLRSGPLARWSGRCAPWEATEVIIYFRWGYEGLAPVCRRLGKGGLVCDRAGEEVGVGVRCRSSSPIPTR